MSFEEPDKEESKGDEFSKKKDEGKNKNEDDELCKFDEYGEIIKEGPISEEKRRRKEEAAAKILEKIRNK